jgi:glycosyltransferase involved in cell wall biosynthesis
LYVKVGVFQSFGQDSQPGSARTGPENTQVDEASAGDEAIPPRRGRLGVYQDGPFAVVRAGGATTVAPHPADAPFFRFLSGVGEHFESFVVFARTVAHDRGSRPDVLPPGTEAVELPDYGDLRRVPAVARSLVRTARAFWAGVDRVDTVWTFGPHPFEFLLVAVALVRGRRVVLGVRQDTPAYFRARLPSPRWKPVLVAVDGMDAVHRLLARRIPTTVVGTENAQRYASRRGRIFAMTPTLVRANDLVAEPAPRDWSGPIELLTVGRIDREKNPLLLVEAVAALGRERPAGFRLTWVGLGPLADAVREHAAALGIAEAVELPGYIPFGPELLARYRRAHAFVHVSLTEGVPQVLTEAHASGTPIVATDVGGVRAALEDGRAGLLVPPDDLDALVGAVRRLAADERLRAHLVERGLELARVRTLEAEAARVAAFIGDAR